MSTDFSGLKLCLPNGGCTSDHEVQIDKGKILAFWKLHTHWLIVAALQKSIDDGRIVSQWRLVTELIGSPPKVTCSAVQILPNGMAFERICSNSALISCPADDLKSLTSNCAIFAAVFSVAGFVLGCILCGILWALSHGSGSRHCQCFHAVEYRKRSSRRVAHFQVGRGRGSADDEGCTQTSRRARDLRTVQTGDANWNEIYVE
uniref:Transmembrane protein n=1 Tax=Macrostomum lignano TaxID=282301 RepID=A0A1I8HN96_9PLAT